MEGGSRYDAPNRAAGDNPADAMTGWQKANRPRQKPKMKIRHKLNKFNAVRSELDGIKFASKKEARYYSELKLRQKSGEVLFFLRQVPLHLPGGVRYVVDFVIFTVDGSVDFVDVKGMPTPLYLVKKKIVEAVYPIKIQEA